MLSEKLTSAVLCLVIFKMFLCQSYAFTITNWSSNPGLDNVRLTTNIGLLTTPSVIACAVECANVLPCMSYSYHSGDSTCLLYSIPFTAETTAIVNEDGWQTYNSMHENCPTALGYFYQRNLNMCYRLESELVTIIAKAMVVCSVEGRMLRIDTIEKQGHISEFLASLPPYSLYIGGLSEHMDDLFLYEDGTPLDFFFWDNDNPKHQPYIRLKKHTFAWLNGPGIGEKPYICEIPL